MDSLIRKISAAAAVLALGDDERITRKVSADPEILSCGCIVAGSLIDHIKLQSVSNNSFTCPSCHSEEVFSLGIQKQLAHISQLLLDDSVSTTSSSLDRHHSPITKRNQSFLTAFQEAFQEAQKTKMEPYNSTRRPSAVTFPIDENSMTFNSIHSSSPPDKRTSISSGSITNSTSHKPNVSNLTKMIAISPNFNNTNPNTNTTVQHESRPIIISKNQELLLAKNFPFYRRLFTYKIHPTFLLQAKTFISTSISPNIQHLALLSEKKWEVWIVDPNSPQRQPILFCEGRSDGSYGKGELIPIKKSTMVRLSNFGDPNNQKLNELSKSNSIGASMALLDNWEHLTCKLTENLLIIGGTRGFLRIIRLNGPNPGKLLYTYQAKFPIRCFDVSPDESMIAIGVTCRDKYTQIDQAVIISLKLELAPNGELIVASYPFTLPYRDPLILLKFSPDSNLLSVATALESRFMTILIKDPTRPSLLMKSQRRLDTTLDAEGITDLSYFPDERLMSLTSVSHSSSPIILDTNIPSINSPDGIARPKLIMRVDEVGSLVHTCVSSPRGDAIAYLGRNGTIYVVSFSSTRLEDHSSRDSRKTVDVASVTRGTCRRDAASLQWDREGYRLWALDRLGSLTIVDWVAGTVDDLNVSRCKIVG